MCEYVALVSKRTDVNAMQRTSTAFVIYFHENANMAAFKMSEVKTILNIGLFKSRKSTLISDPVEGRRKICSYCEGALLRSVPARSLVIQIVAASDSLLKCSSDSSIFPIDLFSVAFGNYN